MKENIFKRITSTSEKKALVENFFFLSCLQVTDYALPLITLPYLVRVLGPEKYGLIAFAQALVQYFVILADYSFNLSATREISINVSDKNKVSEIFSSVMAIKFCFMIIGCIILSVMVACFARFKSDWVLYFLTFSMIFGQVLFPVWFFQGMQKMKYITFLNITSKVIFTISIFIFVRKMQDYIYVPLINSLGFLFIGVLALWIAYAKFEVYFVFPTLESIKKQLRDGWHIFISRISMSLYATSSTFILGLFTNNTFVGYYSGADKIVRAVQKLSSPMSDSVYPYISKLANESKEKALKFIRKLLIFAGGASMIASLVLFLFAKPIIGVVLGHQYQESVIVLKILAFVPFLAISATILGTQTMLAFNLKEAFSKILISAGVINITLALLLTPLYKQIGISISVLCTEFFVAFTMFFYLKSKNLIQIHNRNI